MRVALAAVTVLALVGPTEAKALRCMVTVTRPVPAEEEPTAILGPKDSPWGPVTQLRIDRKTSKAVFCAHGDYCYAAASLAIISPCRFSPDKFADDEQVYFSAE